MEIPTFFTERKSILEYDYSKLIELRGTKNDHTYLIPNLSIDDEDIFPRYFKSIIMGYNHIIDIRRDERS